MASDELVRVGFADAPPEHATEQGRTQIIDGGPRAAAAPAVATGRGD
ncbi:MULTISPECIES: hypothetical protein [Rhodoplanes]|nr:hypothetical protein [Rhodoplanes elegans]